MVVATGDAILYAVLLLILFSLEMFVVYVIFTLKGGNPRNEEGNLMGISLQKYVRVVLIGLTYGLVLLTLNLMNAVAQELTDVTQFAGIIGGLFITMATLAWYWTIAIIIWLMVLAYRDSSLYKQLMKAYEEAGG